VPFLILFATLLFMAQARSIDGCGCNRSFRNQECPGGWARLCFSFFGDLRRLLWRGNGILMLAAMGLLGLHDLNRANGIKTFLVSASTVLLSFSFAMTGLVVWPVPFDGRGCINWWLFWRQDGGSRWPANQSGARSW